MGVDRMLLGGVAMMALSMPHLAWAQTTATADAAATEDASEIVVTAQRRAQSLQDVPASIQAIRGEELERTGTNQLADLVDFIPGASVVSAVAPGFETIQIRGISSGTVGDATVGYYVDDVVFGIPNLQLAPPSRLFDLERTEVLRGPQGTLYGNGAMGGLIRLITAAPNLTETVVRGRGELSFTKDGGTNYAADAVLSVPLATDKAGLRITGGYEKLSGFAETPQGATNVNDTESYSIRAKLLLRPTETIDLTLSAWRIHNEQDYGNNLLTVKPYVTPSAFGVTEPFIETTANIYSGLLRWDLGGVTLESATSYIDHELKFDIVANVVASGLGVRAIDDFDTTSFNQEVRLISSGDGPFNWVLGSIYNNSKIQSFFDVTIVVPVVTPPIIVPFQKTFDAPLRTKSFAVYGEASYDLLDGQLIPLVGLRYYRDKRSAQGFSSISGGAATFDRSSETYEEFSPRFNLTYKPGDDTTLFVNVAKGFRSGALQTAGQVFFAGLQNVSTSVALPEDKLWSYEVGAKLALGGRRVFIDGAVYYTDWRDIQIPFNTAAGIVALVTGGDARIYGVDLGLNWRVTDALTLQAIGNVNKSEFRGVNPALAAALVAAKNGRQLPGVPKGNATFAASYAGNLNDTLKLNLYASYSHRGRQTDLGSGFASARLDQVALRAGVGGEIWRFDLFAENLTNERGPAVKTSTAEQPLYPRRLGAVLAFDF